MTEKKALQINEATKYKTLSDKNRFREWKLAPQRGIIKDYFDKEIASNEKVYQLHITPENTLDIESLFTRLKTILNLKDEKIFYLKKKNLKSWTLGRKFSHLDLTSSLII